MMQRETCVQLSSVVFPDMVRSELLLVYGKQLHWPNVQMMQWPQLRGQVLKILLKAICKQTKKQQNPHNYKTKTLLFTTILYSVHSISNKHEIFSTATSAPFYPCHYIYMYQIHGSSVLQWGAVLNRCQSRKWLRLRSGCWLKMCDAAGEVSHNRTSLSLELDFQNRAH